MSFDKSKPADGTDCASVDNEIRANFEGIQNGDHWTSATEVAYKEEGTAWYDSTNDLFKLYNGSSWDTVLFNKSYDSDWFAIANDTAYTKTHSLGTTAIIAVIYGKGASAEQALLANSAATDATRWRGVNLADVTTTTAVVHVDYVENTVPLADKTREDLTHVRIVLLALE